MAGERIRRMRLKQRVEDENGVAADEAGIGTAWAAAGASVTWM